MPEWLVNILGTIGAAFAAALSAYIISLLNKITQKANIEVSAAEKSMLDDFIKDSVAFVFQTYTQELKDKAADGKLTADEAKEALTRATNLVREKSLTAGVSNLKSIILDDDKLKKLIEAKIPQIKDAIGDWR